MIRFICSLFFISLLSVEFYSQQPTIRFLPSTQISYIDSSAFVIIRFENMQNLRAYSITVSYNPSLIKYQNITRMDFFSSWQTFFFFLVDSINGTIQIDEAILGAYAQSGSGDILKIKFNATALGTCNLIFSDYVLKDLNNQNMTADTSNAVIHIIPLVSVYNDYESNESVDEFFIYPNPFNSSTNIFISSNSHKTFYLKIFNVVGHEVYNLEIDASNKKETLIWNAVDNHGGRLPSGIYFAMIENTGTHLIRKIVLLK